MDEFFNMASKDLCFILSADLSKLNSMQLAIRRAIEKANPPDVLEAMRQRACLRAETDDIYSVSSEGVVKRRM